MLSLYTVAAMRDALRQPLDRKLHQLLTARAQDIVDKGLEHLTHIVVVQPRNTEDDVVSEVGFSPLVNRIDGRRCGDTEFQPDWDWLEQHNGWWEIVYTAGNSGFAYILFVQDETETGLALHKCLELIRHYDTKSATEPVSRSHM